MRSDGSVLRQDAARRAERFARWMDSSFRIPGTDWTFGLDGLIGLLPGVGDLATGAASLYLLFLARRTGVPPGVLVRMVGNIAVDTLIGAVPVVGDVFDFAYKANRRNAALLRRHLGDSA